MGLYEQKVCAKPPVMITGDQVTHVVTERGVAYLDRCEDLETRRLAIAAVAGDTPVGRTIRKSQVGPLRRAGVVKTAEDLGIDARKATPDRLAAHSLDDLVRISKGLYRVPPGVTG